MSLGLKESMWPSHGRAFQFTFLYKKRKTAQGHNNGFSRFISQASCCVTLIVLYPSGPSDELVHILQSTVALKWWPTLLLKAFHPSLLWGFLLSDVRFVSEHQLAILAAVFFPSCSQSYINGCSSISSSDPLYSLNNNPLIFLCFNQARS